MERRITLTGELSCIHLSKRPHSQAHTSTCERARKSMTIIAIVSQKGGSGKTTLSVKSGCRS
jgi:Mrp family chromosome partitioning ATPase